MVQQEGGRMRHRELPKTEDDLHLSSSRSSGSEDSKIRRASYYVWFLGAEECRGLRGPEVVRPVVQYLIEREKEFSPQKVTLQVSARGIKFLQQCSTSRSLYLGASKHFIPAGALTHVQQETGTDDDIVSAVLLIYNPLTRCPVHIHCYRCDSPETADVLRTHLQQLLQRPEQQAKLAALEGRLASRGLLPSRGGSDGASSGSSVSSGAGSASGNVNISQRMASLYDSLAAELREKLGAAKGSPLLLPSPKGSPLLLPSPDYKVTPERTRIRPQGRNHDVSAACGMLKNQEDDSARSSGIGSDDEPSPSQERHYGGRGGTLEHQYSSDDEWAGYETTEVRGEGNLVLTSWMGDRADPSHATRARSPSPVRAEHAPHFHKERAGRNASFTNYNHRTTKRDFSPLRIFPPRKSHGRRTKERNDSPESPKERFHDARDKFLSLERQCSIVDLTQHEEIITNKPQQQKKTHDDIRRPKEVLRRTPADNYNEIGDENPALIWNRDRRGQESRKTSKDRKNQKEKKIRYFDYLRADTGRHTPDIWEYKTPQRSKSPVRTRTRTPVTDRISRVHRSPERQEYLRAKSMHDLSHPIKNFEDDRRGGYDPRRHSLYDPTDETAFLRDSRKHGFNTSETYLPGRPHSNGSTEFHKESGNYVELPENKRFPGLDRATARPDPLEPNLLSPGRRKFEYPVNGGYPAIHITRTHHDDYRKFRYEHNNNFQYMQHTPSAVPKPHL